MLRDGVAVAELTSVRRTPIDAQTLVERWRHVPLVDGERFTRDVDAVLDSSL